MKNISKPSAAQRLARTIASDILLYNKEKVADGITGAATAEHVFGPYLPAGFPANAVNGLATVRLVREGEPFEPDDTTGWIYRVEDGDIRLNTSTTLRGSTTRYFDL